MMPREKMSPRDQQVAYDMGLHAAQTAMRTMTEVIDTVEERLRSNTSAVAIAFVRHKLSIAVTAVTALVENGKEFEEAVDSMELRFDAMLLEDLVKKGQQGNAKNS